MPCMRSTSRALRQRPTCHVPMSAAGSCSPRRSSLTVVRWSAPGRLLRWEGDTTGARPLLERALAEYERLGNPFEVARTSEYLAEALPIDQRAPVLDAALRQYEQLGATPHIERVRAARVPGGV